MNNQLDISEPRQRETAKGLINFIKILRRHRHPRTGEFFDRLMSRFPGIKVYEVVVLKEKIIKDIENLGFNGFTEERKFNPLNRRLSCFYKKSAAAK